MSNAQSSIRNSSAFCAIPIKCGCGCRVKRFTSSTSENPGRPFYRCETMQQDHLFKWVEEAVLEEVEALVEKVRALDSEVNKLREVKKEVKMLKIGVAAVVCVGVSAMVISKIW